MNILERESAARLAASRRRIAALEGRIGKAASPELFALGHGGMDSCLGGGLARGRLHEIFAKEIEDAASASGYALMLAQRASPCAPVLWVRQEVAAHKGGMVFGSGLVELGLEPDRFIFIIVGDITALLRATDDILRCGGAGALIVEVWGSAPALNLTASRRLALAAKKSGVTALLVRADATPCPSAAQSRWEVQSLASAPLEANAPGGPAMEIELLRHRAGLAGRSWRVEWDRDRLCFSEPALPRAVVPFPIGRPAAIGIDKRWRRSA